MSSPPHPEIAKAIAHHQFMRERMRSAFQVICEAAEIDIRQGQALIQLYNPDAENPTIHYLANRLQIRHHTAVSLINYLEEHGWAKREKDGRPFTIRLTDQGAHKAEVLINAYARTYENIGPIVIEAFSQAVETIRIHDGKEIEEN